MGNECWQPCNLLQTQHLDREQGAQTRLREEGVLRVTGSDQGATVGKPLVQGGVLFRAEGLQGHALDDHG